MAQYTLTNIITNGNFADGGYSGWASNNSATLSVVTIASESGLSGAGSPSVAATRALKVVSGSSQYGQAVWRMDGTEGHKYYYRADMVKPENTKSGGIQLQLQGSPYTAYGENNSTSAWSTWKSLSCIADVQSTALLVACLDVNRTDGTSGFIGYYTNIVLVDLTEAFGSGNEPGLAWCDANISYFEGTVDENGNPVIVIDPAGDHNTNIGSVAYEIESGTVLIGGVLRENESGLVLANGVNREIAFANACVVTITTAGSQAPGSSSKIEIGGVSYTSSATIEVEAGTEMKVVASLVELNDTIVAKGSSSNPVTYLYTISTNISVDVLWGGAGGDVDITEE